MSNAFTNFLSQVGDGLLGKGGATMKDYQHADRLYIQNNYARAPKVGFLYFVNFNINEHAVSAADPTGMFSKWFKKHGRDTGLLVKEVDQPKFTIQQETLNQYNRKTLIQTKMIYQPVSIKFHDDNSDITNNLWKYYYRYYYADSTYANFPNKNGNLGGPNLSTQYGDTKYQNTQVPFGLNSSQPIATSMPFFSSIDIFVLHKGHGESDFTQIRLINPLITEWAHDSLDQNENGKILTNRMNVAYESVAYNQGRLKQGYPTGWVPIYYDHTLSPIQSSIGSLGGVITGFNDIFGEDGSLANANSPLALLGVALQAKNLFQGTSALINSGQATRQGYSILGGVLGGAVGAVLSQNIPATNNGGQGTTGITFFNNNSVSGNTQATASILTTKGTTGQ